MQITPRTASAALLPFFLIALAGCDLTGDVTNDGTETGATVVDDFFGDPFETIDTPQELAQELRNEGLAVTVGQTVSRPFLQATGTELRVENATLQVFEYPTENAAERDLTAVSSDARTIGSTQMTWQGDPHIFRSGRLVVLYVGDDDRILDALEDTLGAQVAGAARRTQDGDGFLNGTGGILQNDSAAPIDDGWTY